MLLMMSLNIFLYCVGIVMIFIAVTIQSVSADRITFGKPCILDTLFMFILEMCGCLLIIASTAGDFFVLFCISYSCGNTVTILFSCLIEKLFPEFYSGCYRDRT